MESIRSVFKFGYGPSSSHTIGPARACSYFRGKNGNAVSFRVTLFGSLAATGKGHGTDIAISKKLEPFPTEIVWKETEELPQHPNGMKFEGFDGQGATTGIWEVCSVGGGDLEDAAGVVDPAPDVYPHSTMTGILENVAAEGLSLWEYVEKNEGTGIWEILGTVWEIMERSIKNGLDNEGLLPGPLKLQRKAASYHARVRNSSGVIKDFGMLFSYALAVSEENAGGGEIVTAPTCGSSGVLPAVLQYLKEREDISKNRLLRGLATAGLVAALIRRNGSISGAEVGCQGEIGSGCAMAAAAAAQIMGGSPKQIEYAAEMAIEHNLGLTCDPILGFVQIPCIERNAIAAGKAIECAAYALFSDGAHKISLDSIIETMTVTGKDLQSAYRETGRGGLARMWTDFGDA